MYLKHHQTLIIINFCISKKIDEIINDLWDIDLSDGTEIMPFNGLLFEDLRVIIFFIN